MFFLVWGKKLKEAQQFWFQNASAAHLAVAGVTCSIFFLLCTLVFLYGTNSLEVWTFPFTESLFWNFNNDGKLAGQAWNVDGKSSENANVFEVSRAFIIAMNPASATTLQKDTARYMSFGNVEIFPGINGTQALEAALDSLLVFTKYQLLFGRSDHMQISNENMLGCLASHVEIWKKIKPGEIVAVMEEDAHVDSVSYERICQLHRDMRGIPWDILILQSPQFINTGKWSTIGSMAATCHKGEDPDHEHNKTDSIFWDIYHRSRRQKNSQILSKELFSWMEGERTTTDAVTVASNHSKGNDKSETQDATEDNVNFCTWYGTRGYLLTHRGASILLKNVYPIHVQIDALISLTAGFDPTFRMYWTRQNVVHQKYYYMSKVWDGCFKCFMPQSVSFYVYLLIALGFVLVMIACQIWSYLKSCQTQQEAWV